jgi:universal stress protein A
MSPYQHILLTTDFSRCSEIAAERAKHLAQNFEAKLTLLHVIEHFPEDITVDVVAPEDVDPKQFLTRHFKDQLTEFAKRTGLENSPRYVELVSGPAKHEIVRMANTLDVDLIILGAHGRHRVADLLGSTTTGVLHHAKCDVLSVRTNE